jgi:hypothetical protein
VDGTTLPSGEHTWSLPPCRTIFWVTAVEDQIAAIHPYMDSRLLYKNSIA